MILTNATQNDGMTGQEAAAPRFPWTVGKQENPASPEAPASAIPASPAPCFAEPVEQRAAAPASPEASAAPAPAVPPASSPSPEGKQENRPHDSFRRRRVLALVLAACVVAVIVLAVNFASSGGVGRDALPMSDEPDNVLFAQLVNNTYLGDDIAYDRALTFENYPGAGLTKGKTLSLADDNFLKNGADGEPVLVDASVFARLIQFNSDWVGWANGANEQDAVDASFTSGKGVRDKYTEKADGAEIAFHILHVGPIYTSGRDYYVLTQETFSRAKDGVSEPREQIYVYKLVSKGGEILIEDFEAL
jgi:hypothetical protein